ncbi:helix-turn-helix transcriptional regulator [Devosia sp.]|jgi:prophage regulatory protein|uniref:helix-turn-helix transcriptional regulator n=1 Tax=Devosia sp. TaxID=1871048 RepID=UPI0039C89657
MPTRLLRRTEVEALTTLSRSAIFDGVRRGKFPAPIRISPRRVAWDEADIDAWLAERRSSSTTGGLNG